MRRHKKSKHNNLLPRNFFLHSLPPFLYLFSKKNSASSATSPTVTKAVRNDFPLLVHNPSRPAHIFAVLSTPPTSNSRADHDQSRKERNLIAANIYSFYPSSPTPLTIFATLLAQPSQWVYVFQRNQIKLRDALVKAITSASEELHRTIADISLIQFQPVNPRPFLQARYAIPTAQLTQPSSHWIPAETHITSRHPGHCLSILMFLFLQSRHWACYSPEVGSDWVQGYSWEHWFLYERSAAGYGGVHWWQAHWFFGFGSYPVCRLGDFSTKRARIFEK